MEKGAIMQTQFDFSDKWTLGLVDPRTNKTSDLWAFSLGQIPFFPPNLYDFEK